MPFEEKMNYIETREKDLMTKLVGVVEEVVPLYRDAHRRGKRARREEYTMFELSFLEIYEAIIAEANAKAPDPSSKVEKVWNLHEAYR